MIFGSIGTLIDKIKELVVNYLEGLSEQFDNTINTIRDDISGVSKKIDEVKSAVDANNIDENIQDLQKKTAQIESGISEGVQGELGNVKQILDNRFNSVDEQLKTVAEKVEQLVGDRARELENLRGEAAEAKTLSSTLAEKEKYIGELNEQIAELKTNLFNAENVQKNLCEEIAVKQADVDAAKAELETERQSSAATKKALQVWRDSVAIYAPVRDSMNNCEVFRKFLEGRGLLGDSDEVLFSFVQELGKTMDFLRDVHQAALEARKTQGNNPAFMSKEEIAVYESLNSCYRRIWNIKFDIFVTPGERKSLSENFYKIPFNKDDAVVLKDPRNRSLKFVKDIYVPLLLNREKRMYKQAYVEASNL